MEQLLWTGLFLPLASFLFLLLFSFYLPRRAVEVIGPASIFLSFVCFLLLGKVEMLDSTLYTWISFKDLNATVSLHLDHLSHLMTLIITGVGFLIHAYSVGYMEHDEDSARYFSVMNFFIFSMLLLVLSSNLLLFFVGWEGVGVASYLLIGYWYRRPSAAKAAKKAFVVNRIGDLGLLLGIFLTFQLFGTSDIHEVSRRVPNEFVFGAPIIALLALLYFWGATAKSAQIPLHVWLPDAMEGPTPVSALIHAATMVTAGVYLVVRMHSVFAVAPFSLQVVGIVGGVTSLYSALCATSQTDVKRVLAYSTISQLGLMFLACGVGAYFAAMFHLTMHAFVKALLFLSAGSAIHMLHDTTEMGRMGGLAKYLPLTSLFFFIGALSMGGIPPLAIFFSKDLIIEDVSHCSPCYLAGLLVSLLTAFYLMRAYLLTFRGPTHVEPSILRGLKEAPMVMMVPVAVLGVLSIIGGLFGFATKELRLSLYLTYETMISIAVAVAGIALAFLFKTRLSATFDFLFNSFYINQLYQALIVTPLRALSKAVSAIFEPQIFDASMQLAAAASTKTAKTFQEIQSGQIRSYVAWIVIGGAFLVIYLSFGGF